MSGKRIVFGADAREKIRKGVDTLADAVKVTLGPLEYKDHQLFFLQLPTVQHRDGQIMDGF